MTHGYPLKDGNFQNLEENLISMYKYALLTHE